MNTHDDFVFPGGLYQATITNFSFGNYGSRVLDVGIRFDVVLDDEANITVEKYEYYPLSLKRGSLFRGLMEQLLGKEFFTQHQGQPFPFRALIGTPCFLAIEHTYNEDIMEQISFVVGMRPDPTRRNESGEAQDAFWMPNLDPETIAVPIYKQKDRAKPTHLPAPTSGESRGNHAQANNRTDITI